MAINRLDGWFYCGSELPASSVKMQNGNAIILFAILVITPTCLSKFKLLTVLPLKHDSRPTSSWERGLEILPGAQVAIEQVNQDIMPPDYKLELKVDCGQWRSKCLGRLGIPHILPG